MEQGALGAAGVGCVGYGLEVGRSGRGGGILVSPRTQLVRDVVLFYPDHVEMTLTGIVVNTVAVCVWLRVCELVHVFASLCRIAACYAENLSEHT